MHYLEGERNMYANSTRFCCFGKKKDLESQSKIPGVLVLMTAEHYLLKKNCRCMKLGLGPTLCRVNRGPCCFNCNHYLYNRHD